MDRSVFEHLCRFAELDVAIGHLLGHEDDVYKCKECGKSNKKKQVIRRHIEAMHMVTPGFPCDLCGTLSKTRNSLQMHKRYVHYKNNK